MGEAVRDRTEFTVEDIEGYHATLASGDMGRRPPLFSVSQGEGERIEAEARAAGQTVDEWLAHHWHECVGHWI